MPSPFTKADYQIGIICALDVEEAAMIAMLDEKHLNLSKDPADPSQYTLGRIGQHNVVVACLPAGSMGNAPAATVASNMQRSFPIKFGLMVGIGGGVWSKKNDIRLGDIVVSEPTEMHGGVVQWDYGKTESEGRFTRKGTLNKPPPILRHAIRALKTKTRMEGLDIQGTLDTIAKKYPVMEEEYSFPGADNDNLFIAAYDHPDDHPDSDDCEGCDSSSIQERPSRKFPTPKVFYGNIASGNQVMKHGITRDRIAKDENVICFEMEAAGLMDEFPCLVIRGICEYADSHKNEKWQPYAAATAAAFAKILLGVVSSQEVTDTPRLVRVLPFGRNANFVGRRSYLDKLLEIFNKDATGDYCPHAALDGLGGVGKTQIALQFAFELQKHSPEHSMFWVQASDVTSFEKSYLEIGRKLGIPGIDDATADVKKLVKNQLNLDQTGKWLLIIDNADNSDIFYDIVDQSRSSLLLDDVPNSSLGGILFTTRDHKAATQFAPQNNVIQVRDMDRVEAKDLLRRSLQREELINDDNSTTELLDLLVNLPLAIVQAVSFINENQTTIAQYTQIFKESDASMVQLLSRGFEDERRYKGQKDPVATTWLISFTQIKSRDPLAAEYMEFMSCIRAQAIPQGLLPLAPCLQQTESIGTLKAYAFIQERKELLVYDMHRLVHIAMINWLTKEKRWSASGETAVKHIAEVFPYPEHENKSIWTAYLPHAETVIEVVQDLAGLEKPRWELFDKIGRCFSWTKQSVKSEKMSRSALQLKESILGKDNQSVLDTRSNIATSLNDQGKYTEAEKMHRETLALREQVLGQEHPHTLTSMSELAQALSNQGKYAEAEKMHRETLALREQVLGQEHPETLTSRHNLALALNEQGKYAEAEKIHRETLALREQVLGQQHPHTLTSMSNLALALSDQGKYVEAERMHRETLALREQVLGQEHPETLTSMNNLAQALSNQGKYVEAEKMHRETLALSEQVLGREHPETLVSINNLALALSDQRKYAEAEKMHRETLALREQVLGQEHPHTLTSINNLAQALSDQGNYAEAEKMHRKTLALREQVLGQEHPHTLTSMSNLAQALSDQGKYVEAEKMHRETLALREQVLGQEHPETLVSINNLALALSD